MPFEVVEAGSPHEAVGREPLVEVAQRVRPYSIDAPLGIRSHLDQARLAQDPQVLGNRGLAHPQGDDELADRALGLPQEIEDSSPVGLREDLERLTHGLSITKEIYNCQGN